MGRYSEGSISEGYGSLTLTLTWNTKPLEYRAVTVKLSVIPTQPQQLCFLLQN